jgi:hypothetical protein
VTLAVPGLAGPEKERRDDERVRKGQARSEATRAHGEHVAAEPSSQQPVPATAETHAVDALPNGANPGVGVEGVLWMLVRPSHSKRLNYTVIRVRI